MSTNPDPESAADAAAEGREDLAAADSERWPIGFMLTIAMVTLYVGYRLVQLTVRFFQWLL
jgi:hypothetical protein